MKRLFFTLILLAAALYGSAQIVPVKAKTFQITYGAQTFSINLNGDSVLVSSTNRVWFNKKFGSDTLLFGDGTFMTTAAVPGLTDTGYVKTTGDTIHGRYWFNGNSELLVGLVGYDAVKINNNILVTEAGSCDGTIIFDSTYISADNIHFHDCFWAPANGTQTTDIGANGISSDREYKIESDEGLIINSPTLTINGRFNGINYDGDNTDLINDASVVLTSGIYGWGEVYAFNAGAIDEWAEFIISSDGTVYLKSNSTDVANTDTANKLCIFDNGAGVTIRNRLGGARTIKYIIHH